MQSYNSSAAWSPPQNRANGNAGHAGSSVYRHRQSEPIPQHPTLYPRSVSTGPPAPPPRPPRPPSLTPGGFQHGQPETNNATNHYYGQQSDYGFPRRASDAASNPAVPFYSNVRPRYTQSYIASSIAQRPKPPPLPRKPINMSQVSLAPPMAPPVPPKPSFSVPPIIPPKITLYPESIPVPINNPPLNRVHPPPPKNAQVSPPSPEDDKELALALALSASNIQNREDDELDELERALEESRLTVFQTDPPTFSSKHLEYISPDDTASWLTTPTAASHSLSTSSKSSEPVELPEEDGWFSTSPEILAAQLSDDEALARRLAADTVQSVNKYTPPPPPSPSPSPPPLPPPQQQQQQKTNSLYSALPEYSISDASSTLKRGRSPSAPPRAFVRASVERIPSPQPDTISEAPLSRHDSIKSASSQQSGPSDVNPRLSPPRSGPPPSNSLVVAPEASSVSVSWSPANPQQSPATPSIPQNTSVDTTENLNASHFVERELLVGVSLGYSAPVISTTLTPMASPMPNIITLPYGKSPPLHLQAPSWRHLLKLMARLSGTRIEPSIETVAVTKGELKLRTVVQFVKPHNLSSEWRIILYLTIDHPIPPNAPNAWKYTNGDVSTLPWSYTLSDIPGLLRGGADTPAAVYYTIPSTAKTPYPILPIDLPNMAMYLQSALEDSRRAMCDISSGLRKLAKCVESCCSAEREAVGVEDTPDKRSFFKKVIGRGNKQPRGGNEEVYEFVTPFMANEWG